MAELFSSSETDDQNATAQPYRVLARKYRPQLFEDLIGQEAMVRTLANAIQTGRLPQAWMLTGVRGIGKTTTARIIARALNCTGADGKGGPTLSPCGVCDACRAIAEDRHVDVQEMDAASRTGVDDIRDIIDGVRYGPVSARYKIYILDEVHMLSKNAFNALLKTLEEPPPHTKFIFATTEIRKVPITVLSRCQRFDLRRIDEAGLAAHYGRIAEKEGVTAEAEALRLIAHAADGSVRDGLSLLDQAIARGGGAITAADVKDMLGLADRTKNLDLCRLLLSGDMPGALACFDDLMQAGADPLQTLQDLAGALHQLTRTKVTPAEIDTLPEADRDFVKAMVGVTIPALTRAWQILLKGIAETQTAPRPVEAAEMALIRLGYAAELPPPGDLIRKIKEQGGAVSATPQTGGAAPSGGGTASASSHGGGAPVRMGAMRGGVSAALRAAPVSEPVPAVAAEAVARAPSPSPTQYRDLVALFIENREGGLYGQLYNFARPVRCEPGLLEISLDDGASESLAPQVAQRLTAWTGRRWMVSIAARKGGATLAEDDKERQKERLTRVKAHPLTAAVLTAFEGAEVVAIREKTVAAAESAAQDDDLLVTDDDRPEALDD